MAHTRTLNCRAPLPSAAAECPADRQVLRGSGGAMGRPGPEGPDAVVVRPAGAGVSLPPACGQGGGMMKKPPVLCHLVLFLVFFFSEKCAVALNSLLFLFL